MTFYVAVNEAPLVVQFTGEFPEDVMREAADYLTEARDRGETLTHWTVWPDLRDGEPMWHGTLTTAGAGYVAPWEDVEESPAPEFEVGDRVEVTYPEAPVWSGVGTVTEIHSANLIQVTFDRGGTYNRGAFAAEDLRHLPDPALAEWERELLAEDDPQSEFSAWLDDVQSDVDLTPGRLAVLDLPERCDRVLHVRDGFGNGWEKCGPNCDMQVVRPGKVQCSCDDEPAARQDPDSPDDFLCGHDFGWGVSCERGAGHSGEHTPNQDIGDDVGDLINDPLDFPEDRGRL